MSVYTVAMRRDFSGDLESIAETLQHKLKMSAENICSISHGTEGNRSFLVSCEKFFFRTSSYASLNVMLTEFAGVQTADIVGSGGGTGLLNISWYANSELAEEAEKILQNCGFTTVEKKD